MIGVSFSHYLKEFYRPLISFLTLALGIHFGLKPLLDTPDFIAIGLSLILAISLQIGLIYLYDSKTFSHLYSLVQKNLNRN